MSNKKETSIKDALGLGEVIHFSDGTQLPCVPACLADLTDAMASWQVYANSGLALQGFYLPGNEKVRDAFEEVLFIACGKNIPKEELRKKVSVTGGGREVMAFIDRFLGFNQPDAGAEEAKG